MKCWLSPRCASATKIVRPRQSTVAAQPQLQPALLRLSAMISQYFTRRGFCLFCSPHANAKIALGSRISRRPITACPAQRGDWRSIRRIRQLSAHALPFSWFWQQTIWLLCFRVNDSRWIKWLAIATAVLTVALVFLTIVLARYASRLDALTDSLVVLQRSSQPSRPTPEQSLTPTPTVAPVPRAIPVDTPTVTPSPSPQPTRTPRRHSRRHR